ncbi:MAG: acetyl-CoA C-acyltransferase [Planctomycetota bacterium]|nr:MAG: acetyl-CoA C-acyltransferase [Planctomycetota bacterium]
MPCPILSRPPETTPVIVACCRTAIGRSHSQRGVFRDVRGDELATAVVAAAVSRSGVDPTTVEDLLLGATQQRGELGGNVARAVALMAGLPLSTAAATVNRLCGSGLEVLSRAAHAIIAGAENVQVVAGVEHMHHLPMDSAVDFHPRVAARSSRGMLSMGMTAEHLAATDGITRRQQEEYALESHARAARAADAGLFDDEIVTVLGHDEAGGVTEVMADQSVRRDTSLEAMCALEPAFLPGLGTITAATSAPLSDGAAALVVMSQAEAARQGLVPLVRVVATAVVGVPPAMMGTGPVAATRKLLARTGIDLADIDLVELNEAFAAQAIHCIAALGFDAARVNVRGGALAIGHPLGASGVRIVTTLVHAMRDRGDRLGLATMCIGLGQGIAVLLERMES